MASQLLEQISENDFDEKTKLDPQWCFAGVIFPNRGMSSEQYRRNFNESTREEQEREETLEEKGTVPCRIEEYVV